MAPKKRKDQATNPKAIIEVTFAGRKPLDWTPTLVEASIPSQAKLSFPAKPASTKPDSNRSSASTDSSDLPQTEEELRDRFVNYLRAELHDLDAGSNDGDAGYVGHLSATALSQLKKEHLAAIAAMTDPNLRIMSLSLSELRYRLETGQQRGRDRALTMKDVFFITKSICFAIVRQVETGWAKKQGTILQEIEGAEVGGDGDGDDDNDEPPSKRRAGESSSPGAAVIGRRSNEDKTAQKSIPFWYGRKCVLSGGDDVVEGAHIVPVRTKSAGLVSIWESLTRLWPLPDMAGQADEMAGITNHGNEHLNVLPLNPTAHALWDKYRFALRPIADPEQPDHRLYLQMVWLSGGHQQQEQQQWGSIVDFRRPQRRGDDGDKDDQYPHFPPVCHGDVLQLATPDPATRPLPNMRLLQMQYGAHRLLSGMRSAGALSTIFSGNPPQDGDDDGDDDLGSLEHLPVPPEWESLLGDAVETGVLSQAASRLWARAFVREYALQARELGVPLPSGSKEKGKGKGKEAVASPSSGAD